MITSQQESRPSAEGPERSDPALDAAAAELEGLSEEEASARLRETMQKLTGELHRLEENYQALLRIGEENFIEGGTDNGSD